MPDTIGGENRNIRRLKMVLAELAVNNGAGSSIAELTRRTGLNRSSVNRIVGGLLSSGLATKDQESGRLILGSFVSSWVANSFNRYGIAVFAAPKLLKLSRETNDIVSFNVKANSTYVCVDQFEISQKQYGKTVSVGDRRPVGFGASGIVLLAFQPKSRREKEIATVLSDLSQLGISETYLRSAVDAARQVGYCLDENQVIPGISSIAVPIEGSREVAIAAVEVTAVSESWNQQQIEQVLNQIRNTVSEINKYIGQSAGRSSR